MCSVLPVKKSTAVFSFVDKELFRVNAAVYFQWLQVSYSEM